MLTAAGFLVESGKVHGVNTSSQTRWKSFSHELWMWKSFYSAPHNGEREASVHRKNVDNIKNLTQTELPLCACVSVSVCMRAPQSPIQCAVMFTSQLAWLSPLPCSAARIPPMPAGHSRLQLLHDHRITAPDHWFNFFFFFFLKRLCSKSQPVYTHTRTQTLEFNSETCFRTKWGFLFLERSRFLYNSRKCRQTPLMYRISKPMNKVSVIKGSKEKNNVH